MQEGQVTVDGVAPPAARALRRPRHREPDRVRGDLPAPRGAARPVPDEADRRLPLGRGGGGSAPPPPLRRRSRPLSTTSSPSAMPARSAHVRAEVDEVAVSDPIVSYVASDRPPHPGAPERVARSQPSGRRPPAGGGQGLGPDLRAQLCRPRRRRRPGPGRPPPPADPHARRPSSTGSPRTRRSRPCWPRCRSPASSDRWTGPIPSRPDDARSDRRSAARVRPVGPPRGRSGRAGHRHARGFRLASSSCLCASAPAASARMWSWPSARGCTPRSGAPAFPTLARGGSPPFAVEDDRPRAPRSSGSASRCRPTGVDPPEDRGGRHRRHARRPPPRRPPAPAPGDPGRRARSGLPPATTPSAGPMAVTVFPDLPRARRLALLRRRGRTHGGGRVRSRLGPRHRVRVHPRLLARRRHPPGELAGHRPHRAGR